MFSKTCEYGIRALSIIAKHSNDGKKINIKELCKESNTPESFTAKILQILVKRRIIKSQKGRQGGFYIDRNMDDISLKEVIIAFDGDELFVGCGLGLEKCDSKNPCPLHFEFEKIRNSIIEMSKRESIASLAEKLSESVYNR